MKSVVFEDVMSDGGTNLPSFQDLLLPIALRPFQFGLAFPYN
jgi:hypothetical protein